MFCCLVNNAVMLPLNMEFLIENKSKQIVGNISEFIPFIICTYLRLFTKNNRFITCTHCLHQDWDWNWNWFQKDCTPIHYKFLFLFFFQLVYLTQNGINKTIRFVTSIQFSVVVNLFYHVVSFLIRYSKSSVYRSLN